jgi:hypothetical protein
MPGGMPGGVGAYSTTSTTATVASELMKFESPSGREMFGYDPAGVGRFPELWMSVSGCPSACVFAAYTQVVDYPKSGGNYFQSGGTAEISMGTPSAYTALISGSASTDFKVDFTVATTIVQGDSLGIFGTWSHDLPCGMTVQNNTVDTIDADTIDMPPFSCSPTVNFNDLPGDFTDAAVQTVNGPDISGWTTTSVIIMAGGVSTGSMDRNVTTRWQIQDSQTCYPGIFADAPECGGNPSLTSSGYPNLLRVDTTSGVPAAYNNTLANYQAVWSGWTAHPASMTFAGWLANSVPARAGAGMNPDGTYRTRYFPIDDQGVVANNDGTVFNPTAPHTPAPVP